ncbi:16S rRNA (cytosine(967)-C(5))-methyltransferase RsmB [Legionella shakespearei]|uniref:16S rRNA (cytosine(967)-C(5))-methyltransferase n=1 Tax=Legionella shakespearei DSM 23087 TaxID=1122169 RepID=A0A0W0Z879_9GAMM|nr:16S rRNA (cytosine(967)-C(5))-methyltransferase RsmB [Legionella shakespearei]KTD65123.1 16S rRNA methyltransferase [Legionella shakespearei DSM 23087]
MKNNERLQALKILTSLLEEKSSLSQLMPPSADVTPMTKEICFGFCRHYFRLQAIADCLVDKRPKAIEVWIALLMGIYQLHYMNKPDYAVVKETVALLEKIKKVWAKGLVNAVLRNFCRQQSDILARLESNPAFHFGQPQWLLKRLKADWPEDWGAIALANDAHPPMTLRVNKQKHSTADYLDILHKAGIAAALHPIASDAIILTIPCDVHSLPGFSEGCVSVQDAAAQLALPLLSLEPGLRVLDACCAPGGKTCHILESQPDLSACIAMDVDPKRLKRVKENMDRLQLNATLVQGDALAPALWWDGIPFDRILLDAPCSATGVIRRHSDIKLLRTEDEVKAVVEVQQSMLEAMWPLLAPGGRMVYATCSIMADENEKQIKRFVTNHPDCQIWKDNWGWGRATPYGQQILPGEYEMDGFFYSVLIKSQ